MKQAQFGLFVWVLLLSLITILLNQRSENCNILFDLNVRITISNAYSMELYTQRLLIEEYTSIGLYFFFKADGRSEVT